MVLLLKYKEVIMNNIDHITIGGGNNFLQIFAVAALIYCGNAFSLGYEDSSYTDPWSEELTKSKNPAEKSNDISQKRSRWDYDENDKELLSNPWNELSEFDTTVKINQEVDDLTNQFKKTRISKTTQQKLNSETINSKTSHFKYKSANDSEKLFNIGSYSKNDDRRYQDFARRHSKRAAEKRKKGWQRRN